MNRPFDPIDVPHRQFVEGLLLSVVTQHYDDNAVPLQPMSAHVVWESRTEALVSIPWPFKLDLTNLLATVQVKACDMVVEPEVLIAAGCEFEFRGKTYIVSFLYDGPDHPGEPDVVG